MAKKPTSLKNIARRLKDAGFTWREITKLIYGHPGTQAYYTAKGVKRHA